MTINVARQERISLLTSVIRDKRDKLQLERVIVELQERGIPSEELEGVTDFGGLHDRLDGHWRAEYCYIFSTFVAEFIGRSVVPSLYDNVLENIKTTKQDGSRMLQNTYADKVYRALVIENTISDPIYNVFGLLQNAIAENRGMIRGVTEEIKDMGEELAINFVETWKSQFLGRIGFSDKRSGYNIKSELSMEEQYLLLRRITGADKKTQSEILRRICEIFPSYHGADFSWIEMKFIVDKILPLNESKHPVPKFRIPILD